MSAFGDDDDAEKLALAAAAVQVGDDFGEWDLELRDDDQVRAAGDAAHQRNPASVSPHHLDNHHAVMRGGGGVETVQRFGHDSDRSIEPDAELCNSEVVVDRLGDPDGAKTSLVELRRDAERVIASDRDKCIDAVVS